MRLWLVRHAAPQVPAGTCYGALDVAADEAATQQAALALAQALPVGVALHSSPIFRSPRSPCWKAPSARATSRSTARARGWTVRRPGG